MGEKTQLVSFTLLRNDATLLESFVRHHCEYLEKMVFLDDHSTDETLQILIQLQQEGMQVILLSGDTQVIWETELQIERIWAETVFDYVLPLQVTEYLIFNQNKDMAPKLCNEQIMIDFAIPCATFGFPSLRGLNPGTVRRVSIRPGSMPLQPSTNWLIVDLPGFSVADYLLKGCVYYLDWIARRRDCFSNIALWKEAYADLKSSSLELDGSILDRKAVFECLEIAVGPLLYASVRSVTARTLSADVLGHCEYFALSYHRRTLEKWPVLHKQNQLSAVENEIGIVLRTRSWQCTSFLRAIAERMRILWRVLRL
jgi:hypothetical protein